MRDSFHNYLHDFYEYVIFLFHIPFHLHHEKVCGIFTLKGAMVCEEPCGYCYDRGYATSDCRKCYDGWNIKYKKTLTQESQS